MKKCKICGYPQIIDHGRRVWFSERGLCSICYFKHDPKTKNIIKKRSRNKRIWEKI